MKRLILLSLISLCFVSCHDDIDDSPTILSGKVLDHYSNIPVSNYRFILSKSRSGLFGTHFGYVDTFKSNDLGEFLFSFTAQNKYKYHFESIDPLYQKTDRQVMSYERINEFIFTVKPYKVLAVKLHSSNEYDNLWVLNAPSIEIKKDTTIYIKQVVPETTYELKLGSCKNGVIMEKETIKVYVETRDTTRKEINI